MDDTIKQWLLDNGHILIMWSKSDTIAGALTKIVSDSKFTNKIRNFYNIDPVVLYTEYNLLSDDSEDKQTIHNGTLAKFKFVRYCEATMKK